MIERAPGTRMAALASLVERGRALVLLAVVAGLAVVVWHTAPRPGAISGALTGVRPSLVALALAVNAVAVLVRAEAWRAIVAHAVPRPRPRVRDTFSAYALGLLVNLLVPARAGEAARVGVLARRGAPEGGRWRILTGTVLAHRMLDVLPLAGLVALTAATAGALPGGPTRTLGAVAVLAVVAAVAVLVGRRRAHGHGARLRAGLSGLGAPRVAAGALALEALAWGGQLAVVLAALAAFGLPASVGMAAAVLLATNIAGAIPLWPGAVGVFQAAVAVALGRFGVSYEAGFAFGIGLQAIEAVSTVLLGLPVLVHEGLSLPRLLRPSRAT